MRAVGHTLEVAIGTGLNLAHYPPGVRLTAVDLTPEMLVIARRRSAGIGAPVVLAEGDAQVLPFADESFDTLVCTYAMCSVPDERAAVLEMRRVLKPGGRLILVDHIRSSVRPIFWLQRLLELAPTRNRDELTRRPRDHVEAVGFTIEESDRLRAGGGRASRRPKAVMSGLRVPAATEGPSAIEALVEQRDDGPRSLGPVRDDGVGGARRRVVRAAEGHAGVIALEPHDVTRRMQPEAEAVALRAVRRGAARPHHLGHSIRGHDPSGEQRAPERGQVRRGRVDAAVAASRHRKMEHVRPRTVDAEVAERGISRKLVRPEVRGLVHARRMAHPSSNELVERHPARALGDQREHDVPAVVVGEPLARRRHRLVAVDHGEVLLGGGSRCTGTGIAYSLMSPRASSSR